MAIRHVPALLGLTGLILFLFRRAVFEGRVFYERDIGLVWYSQVEAFFRSVTAGAWPLWDPFTSFGQPLLANPNAQVFYPFTWLHLILQPWTQYTLFVVAHLGFAGAGLYLLGLRLGLSRLASFVAAALWTLSGPLLSLVNVWHHFGGAAWLPWVLLASEKALDSGRVAHVLLWGAALAAQVLVGSPDMSLLTGLAVAANVLRRLRWTRPRDPQNLRLAASAGGALAFAVALSACQWLPALDVAFRSARFDLPFEARTTWSLHPLPLLEAFFPFRLIALPLRPELLLAWLDLREPFLRSIYLGLASAGLVFAGTFLRSLPSRGFLVALFLGALLVSLGRHTFVYEALTWLVPLLRMLRFPVKAMVVAALAWSLLAGAGFDLWRARQQARRRAFAYAIGVPLLVLSALAGLGALAIRLRADELAALLLAQRPGAVMAAALAPTAARLAQGALFAAAAASLALVRPWRQPFAPAVLVASLAILDLLLVHRDLNAVAPKALFLHRPGVLDAVDASAAPRLYVYDYSVGTPSQRRAGQRLTARYSVARAPAGWGLGQAQALGVQEYLNPPTPGRWGVYGSYELDLLGLYPAARVRLTELLREVERTPAHRRLLQLGGVDYVLALHDDGTWSDLAPVATLPGFFVDPIRVFRVPDPQPRSYVVGGVRVADDAKALELLVDPALDPAAVVVLPQGREQPPGRPGASRILERRPDRVRLEASLEAPGYLVLLEGYDPGWTASVDARPAPVLRANLVFRAVRLDAGKHLVEFRYWPKALTPGLWVSGAALLGGLGLALRSAAARPSAYLPPAR